MEHIEFFSIIFFLKNNLISVFPKDADAVCLLGGSNKQTNKTSLCGEPRESNPKALLF